VSSKDTKQNDSNEDKLNYGRARVKILSTKHLVRLQRPNGNAQRQKELDVHEEGELPCLRECCSSWSEIRRRGSEPNEPGESKVQPCERKYARENLVIRSPPKSSDLEEK